jgi:hypothetical protein
MHYWEIFELTLKDQQEKAVLRIRIAFNADPDQAFHLNADQGPGSQTNADPDPDPGQTFRSQKVKYLHEK